MEDKIGFTGVLEIFERKVGEADWVKIREAHNLITNTGYNTIANRLTGQSTYASTAFPYFSYSNGTGTPVLTDTAATFLADGTVATKLVASVSAYDTGNKTQQWNCYLSSTDNTVASITKFALMDAASPAVMFNELKFTAISKDSTKEFYFRYSLSMVQV